MQRRASQQHWKHSGYDESEGTARHGSQHLSQVMAYLGVTARKQEGAAVAIADIACWHAILSNFFSK